MDFDQMYASLIENSHQVDTDCTSTSDTLSIHEDLDSYETEDFNIKSKNNDQLLSQNLPTESSTKTNEIQISGGEKETINEIVNKYQVKGENLKQVCQNLPAESFTKTNKVQISGAEKETINENVNKDQIDGDNSKQIGQNLPAESSTKTNKIQISGAEEETINENVNKDQVDGDNLKQLGHILLTEFSTEVDKVQISSAEKETINENVNKGDVIDGDNLNLLNLRIPQKWSTSVENNSSSEIDGKTIGNLRKYRLSTESKHSELGPDTNLIESDSGLRTFRLVNECKNTFEDINKDESVENQTDCTHKVQLTLRNNDPVEEMKKSINEKLRQFRFSNEVMKNDMCDNENIKSTAQQLVVPEEVSRKKEENHEITVLQNCSYSKDYFLEKKKNDDFLNSGKKFNESFKTSESVDPFGDLVVNIKLENIEQDDDNNDGSFNNILQDDNNRTIDIICSNSLTKNSNKTNEHESTQTNVSKMETKSKKNDYMKQMRMYVNFSKLIKKFKEKMKNRRNRKMYSSMSCLNSIDTIMNSDKENEDSKNNLRKTKSESDLLHMNNNNNNNLNNHLSRNNISNNVQKFENVKDVREILISESNTSKLVCDENTKDERPRLLDENTNSFSNVFIDSSTSEWACEDNMTDPLGIDPLSVDNELLIPDDISNEDQTKIILKQYARSSNITNTNNNNSKLNLIKPRNFTDLIDEPKKIEPIEDSKKKKRVRKKKEELRTNSKKYSDTKTYSKQMTLLKKELELKSSLSSRKRSSKSSEVPQKQKIIKLFDDEYDSVEDVDDFCPQIQSTFSLTNDSMEWSSSFDDMKEENLNQTCIKNETKIKKTNRTNNKKQSYLKNLKNEILLENNHWVYKSYNPKGQDVQTSYCSNDKIIRSPSSKPILSNYDETSDNVSATNSISKLKAMIPNYKSPENVKYKIIKNSIQTSQSNPLSPHTISLSNNKPALKLPSSSIQSIVENSSSINDVTVKGKLVKMNDLDNTLTLPNNKIDVSKTKSTVIGSNNTVEINNKTYKLLLDNNGKYPTYRLANPNQSCTQVSLNSTPIVGSNQKTITISKLANMSSSPASSQSSVLSNVRNVIVTKCDPLIVRVPSSVGNVKQQKQPSPIKNHELKTNYKQNLDLPTTHTVIGNVTLIKPMSQSTTSSNHNIISTSLKNNSTNQGSIRFATKNTQPDQSVNQDALLINNKNNSKVDSKLNRLKEKNTIQVNVKPLNCLRTGLDKTVDVQTNESKQRGQTIIMNKDLQSKTATLKITSSTNKSTQIQTVGLDGSIQSETSCGLNNKTLQITNLNKSVVIASALNNSTQNNVQQTVNINKQPIEISKDTRATQRKPSNDGGAPKLMDVNKLNRTSNECKSVVVKNQTNAASVQKRTFLLNPKLRFISHSNTSPTRNSLAKTVLLYGDGNFFQKDESILKMFGNINYESKKKYRCPWCLNRYEEYGILFQHFNRITCNLVYECQQCDNLKLLFRNRCKFLRHLFLHFKSRSSIIINYTKLKIFQITSDCLLSNIKSTYSATVNSKTRDEVSHEIKDKEQINAKQSSLFKRKLNKNLPSKSTDNDRSISSPAGNFTKSKSQIKIPSDSEDSHQLMSAVTKSSIDKKSPNIVPIDLEKSNQIMPTATRFSTKRKIQNKIPSDLEDNNQIVSTTAFSLHANKKSKNKIPYHLEGIQNVSTPNKKRKLQNENSSNSDKNNSSLKSDASLDINQSSTNLLIVQSSVNPQEKRNQYLMKLSDEALKIDSPEESKEEEEKKAEQLLNVVSNPSPQRKRKQDLKQYLKKLSSGIQDITSKNLHKIYNIEEQISGIKTSGSLRIKNKYTRKRNNTFSRIDKNSICNETNQIKDTISNNIVSVENESKGFRIEQEKKCLQNTLNTFENTKNEIRDERECSNVDKDLKETLKTGKRRYIKRKMNDTSDENDSKIIKLGDSYDAKERDNYGGDTNMEKNNSCVQDETDITKKDNNESIVDKIHMEIKARLKKIIEFKSLNVDKLTEYLRNVERLNGTKNKEMIDVSNKVKELIEGNLQLKKYDSDDEIKLLVDSFQKNRLNKDDEIEKLDEEIIINRVLEKIETNIDEVFDNIKEAIDKIKFIQETKVRNNELNMPFKRTETSRDESIEASEEIVTISEKSNTEEEIFKTEMINEKNKTSLESGEIFKSNESDEHFKRTQTERDESIVGSETELIEESDSFKISKTKKYEPLEDIGTSTKVTENNEFSKQNINSLERTEIKRDESKVSEIVDGSETAVESEAITESIIENVGSIEETNSEVVQTESFENIVETDDDEIELNIDKSFEETKVKVDEFFGETEEISSKSIEEKNVTFLEETEVKNDELLVETKENVILSPERTTEYILKTIEEIEVKVDKLTDKSKTKKYDSNEEIILNVDESIEETNLKADKSVEDTKLTVDESPEGTEMRVDKSTEETELRVVELIDGTKLRTDESIEGTELRIDESIEETELRVDESIEETELKINESIKGTELKIDESIEGTKLRIDESIEETELKINELIEGTELRVDEPIEGTELTVDELLEETKRKVDKTMERTELEVDESMKESETGEDYSTDTASEGNESASEIENYQLQVMKLIKQVKKLKQQVNSKKLN